MPQKTIEERKEYMREYYKNNREKMIERSRLQRAVDGYKETRSEYLKNYFDPDHPLYQERKEKDLLSKNNYRERNKEFIKTKAKEYRERVDVKKKTATRHQERMKNDIQYAISFRMRGRVRKLLHKNSMNSIVAIEFLGCTISFFKSYIENQFEDWQNWENWGRASISGPRRWNLDHIKPLASFDLTQEKDLKEAFHWSNYQPLEAFANIKKGAKLIALDV